MWTQIHKPIRFAKDFPLIKITLNAHETRLYEDMQVKKVMMQKGIDKVRGGSYTTRDLLPSARHMLLTEIFHANNACLRCGRTNHWVNNCFANTNVFGEHINSHNQPEPQRKNKTTTRRFVQPYESSQSNSPTRSNSDSFSDKDDYQIPR